jgi:ATP-binding cassette subfamily B protein
MTRKARHPSSLRRFLPLLRARRRLLTGTLAGAAGMQLLQLTPPAVVGAAVDDAIVHHRTPLWVFATALALIAAGQFVVGRVFRLTAVRLAAGFEADLRGLVHGALMRQSPEFFDSAATGQLVSRANSDVRVIAGLLTWGPTVLVTITTVLIAAAVLMTISVPLAATALSCLPLLLIAVVRMRRSLLPLSWLVQVRTGDFAALAAESIAGAAVVRSFAAEQSQVDSAHTAAERLRAAALDELDLRAWLQPVVQYLPQLAMVVVLLYGGWLAEAGTLTVGQLVEFVAYLTVLQAPFRFMGFLILLGQRATAGASRVAEILDAPVAITDPVEPLTPPGPPVGVSFTDVTFGYAHSRDVLRGFNLTLEPGETVALVGRSGSGKSTVARLLVRFYDVADGSITVGGVDVRRLTRTDLQATVAIVTEEPFLFSASIRDNLAYGVPEAPLDVVESAAAAAAATAFVHALPEGISTVIGERGYTLSGGQRQRLALGRALVVNPPVLILDDATSALDVRTEAQVHQSLVEQMADRTTLLIAHRLSTIGLADRVALLDGGRVRATGSHEALLATEPAYAALLTQFEHEPEPEPLLGERR